MHIRQRRGSYKYVQYSAPFSRDDNISVADCTSLSSLLKTIKINGDVQCRWTITGASSCVIQLDRSVQFIYTSLFARWQQQHIKAKTKTPAHQWILFVTDSAAKRLNKKLSCRRETASPRDASCY